MKKVYRQIHNTFESSRMADNGASKLNKAKTMMHEMYAQNSKTNEKPYSSDIAIVRYAGKDEESKK